MQRFNARWAPSNAAACARRAVVAKNATVQREGGREVVREIEHFNLDAILSVGYRVNSKRGTQFRREVRLAPLSTLSKNTQHVE